MTWAVLCVAFFEAWTGSADDYYQHRMGVEVRGRATVGVVSVEPWIGGTWWGRPDAKIASSFLNLEATRTLERTYGIDLLARIAPCHGGVSYYRRGVDELDRPRRWGREQREDTHTWSIGYYDGARAIAGCGPVTVKTPWLFTFNDPLTLPSYAWEMAVTLTEDGYMGRVEVKAGGTRGGTIASASVARRVASHVWLGVAVGKVESPGWGPPLKRLAATLEVRR